MGRLLARTFCRHMTASLLWASLCVMQEFAKWMACISTQASASVELARQAFSGTLPCRLWKGSLNVCLVRQARSATRVPATVRSAQQDGAQTCNAQRPRAQSAPSVASLLQKVQQLASRAPLVRMGVRLVPVDRAPRVLQGRMLRKRAQLSAARAARAPSPPRL